MKVKKREQLLCLFLVCLLFVGAFLIPELSMAKERKGDVIVATKWPSFRQRGGDPATQTGGAPFMAQTVFDGLIYEDMNRNQVPALAKPWKIAADWKYIDYIKRYL